MKYFLLFILVTLFVGCKTEPETNQKFKLEEGESGILYEKFDSTVTDINKYNKDNKVFKVGLTFKYHFQHITTEGDTLHFKVLRSKRAWEFVNSAEKDSLTTSGLTIEVLDGNPMGEGIPDYYQTNLKYTLDKVKGAYSTSGVIENEANIWMHPPRDNYFRILELNPFPYIKAPYQIGTKWTWKLKIGAGWGDERWKVWQGSIENKYNYEITDIQVLNTPMGKLDCLVIQSTAESRIGKTGLKAFFNNEYGFVRLNYQNIDGSKTILNLVEKSQPEL